MHKSFTIPPALNVLLHCVSQKLKLPESAVIGFCLDYTLKQITSSTFNQFKLYSDIYYRYHITALPRGKRAKEKK